MWLSTKLRKRLIVESQRGGRVAEKVGCDVDVRGSEGLCSITFGAVVTEFFWE